MVREPIAIVGIGCRFPGASGPAAFWQLLRDGVCAIREVPAERWDVDALYDPDPSAPGKTACRWGAFLDDVSGFDWRAFRVSPREATFIDPQHRLLLEVAWEALEDAGLPFEDVARARAGVFVGLCWNDYMRMQGRDWSRIDGYAAACGPFSFAASRISHTFDLRGPSVAVDTNCASAMATLHYACQCLWSGEIDLALAGGVNLLLSPDAQIMMSKAGVLSPTGRVRTLDAEADGFVRGEGAGLVALRRLSDVGPRDRVYALVRGVAINHNGRNTWIMAPNPAQQVDAIRRAWGGSAVDPAEVDYVELHGTAFPKGDVAETRSIAEALGTSRRAAPCTVGAVKTNIGNLEGAAAVASLVKVALSLHHRELPPTIGLGVANPDIDFTALGLEPQRERSAWPATGTPTAGVNVTSFSGTNGHAVLQAAPHVEGAGPAGDFRGVQGVPLPLLLSGHTPQALAAAAAALAAALRAGTLDDSDADTPGQAAGPDSTRGDASLRYTSSVRRSHHAVRAAVRAGPRPTLLDALDALARGEGHPALRTGRRGMVPVPAACAVALPAAVHGSPLWPALLAESERAAAATARERSSADDRDRLERDPLERDLMLGPATAFASAVAGCAAAAGSDVRAELETAGGPLSPRASFVVHVGLLRLWESWGVKPARIFATRGAGELAAAHVAGELDLHRALASLAEEPGARGSANLDAAALAELEGAGMPLVVFGSAAQAPAPAGVEVLPLPGDLAGLSDVAAALHVRGVPVLWSAVHGGGPGRCISLPPYPWQRERSWLEWLDAAEVSRPPESGRAADGPQSIGRHIGRHVALARPAGAHAWLRDLSAAEVPRRVAGGAVVPEATLVDWLYRAARAVGDGSQILAGVAVSGPLLARPGGRPTQMYLAPVDGGARQEVELLAATAAGWVTYASATVLPPGSSQAHVAPSITELRARLGEAGPAAPLYASLAGAGMVVPTEARRVAGIAWGDGEALVDLEADDGLTLLDGLEALASGIPGAQADGDPAAFILTGAAVVRGDGEIGRRGHAWMRWTIDGDGVLAALVHYGADGAVVGRAEGVRLRPVPAGVLAAAVADADAAVDGPPALNAEQQEAVARLAALPPRPRREALVSRVLDELRAVLALPDDVALGRTQRLFDAGVDSITATDLRRRLQRAFGCSLPATLVFEYPTPEAIAAYLDRRIVPGADAEAPPEIAGAGEQARAVADAEIERRVRELSDDEAEAMLARTLASMEGDL